MAIPSNMPISNASGSSNYMRLQAGENKFRVLGEGISGFLVWKTIDGQRKPIRVRPKEVVPEPEIDPNTGKLERVKIFLAFPVWNYADSKIQVLEITQSGIRNALTDFESEEDYGDLTGYDVKVVKKGEKLETEYSVMPLAKKPISKAIEVEWDMVKLNMEALYEGNSPFEGKTEF